MVEQTEHPIFDRLAPLLSDSKALFKTFDEVHVERDHQVNESRNLVFDSSELEIEKREKKHFQNQH